MQSSRQQNNAKSITTIGTSTLKKPRVPHHVELIPGEPGRFRVESATHPGEHYDVDIHEEHVTDGGLKVYGTCQCKGWSVRKKCTHLDDARQYHADATDTAVVPLPSGRFYFVNKTFLAGMDQDAFDLWFEELCKRDETSKLVSVPSEPRDEREIHDLEAEPF